MLTGLTPPDAHASAAASTIYGHDILTDMESVRYSMGVCPQHDVLFEQLTVREHILFFSQLKGYSYAKAEEEARQLTELFHLDVRLDHIGSELSGGQKRKLSVAIAVCGGSKFIVLDEPTAGKSAAAAELCVMAGGQGFRVGLGPTRNLWNLYRTSSGY
jgi:ATP-binding cassette subfamily A (ABC1) protein 3